MGYAYQDQETLGQIEVDHSLLFGAGLAMDLPDLPVHLSMEVYGRSEKFYVSDHSPLEALLSAGYTVGRMQLTGGLTVGLNDGYGAADWRLFAGVRWGF